jgi:uncharacterized protein (DUF1501 family)
MSSQLSRRRFLQTTGAMSASGLLGSTLFGQMSAMAATASAAPITDYKALVCIFLYGGNDAFNTVLPLDATSWAEYSNKRKLPLSTDTTKPSTNTTLILDTSLRINNPTASGPVPYALHPSLQRIAALYNAPSSKLAVLANVGPLVGPTNKDDYDGGIGTKRPPGLYSHNDQQSLWQSGRSNVDAGGWGGRMAETFVNNSQLQPSPFLSLNTGINTNFVYGDALMPYGLTPSSTGAVKVGKGNASDYLFDSFPRSMLVDVARGAYGVNTTNLLEKDYAALVQRSADAEAVLADSLSQVTLGVSHLGGPMLRELEIVAKMIKANSGQPGRQVFFVRHDGYDTHDTQLESHARLLTELDTAVDFFYRALETNSLLNKTTMFTASDFGRQLANNGDGSDHGWGGHHFILGGAVKGGKIYGRVPSYAPGTNGKPYADPNMIEPSGIMLPEVSTDQYAATLATWFGIKAEADIKVILPNHFGTTNLGFLA